MNELQLKYGCNPNQKPSRIYMEDGSELPIKVQAEDLDISTSSMHSMAGSLYVTSRKQQDFRQQLLSSMFLLQVQQ